MYIPWWNFNYLYRKKISIHATGLALVAGSIVQFTENATPYISAGTVRGDLNDWRIVYWNGSVWNDLYRDAASINNYIFSLQNAITPLGTDDGYYLYYGNANEVTTRQPSTNSEWLKAYNIWGDTPDAYTSAIWIPNSSTSVLYDRMNNHNGTVFNYQYDGANIGLYDDGPTGHYFRFWGAVNGYTNRMYMDMGDFIDVRYNSGMTVEAFVRPRHIGFDDGGFLLNKWTGANHNQCQFLTNVADDAGGGAQMYPCVDTGDTPGINVTGLSANNWYWIVPSWKVYNYANVSYNNYTSNATRTSGLNHQAMAASGVTVRLGQDHGPSGVYTGDAAIIRLSTVERYLGMDYQNAQMQPPTLTLGAIDYVPSPGVLIIL